MKKLHIIFLMPLLGVAFILIQSFGLIRGWTAGANAGKSQTQASQTTQERARLGEEVALHAAGRGSPWINLRDGHDLVTSYSAVDVVQTGRLSDSLENGAARPLALAAGDFDEDGVPDLIVGYACSACSTNLSLSVNGFLALQRGNVDSIYPNAPEANTRKAQGEFTDAPFLSPARVFEVPQQPTFIGAGDFDADGRLDIVIATDGEQRLTWLAGDGQGHFGNANEIALPGRATAMTVGEINRTDGLADVVIGIGDVAQTPTGRGLRTDPGSGSQINNLRHLLLVFEGPDGAFKHEPEAIALPAAASSLALGQLDDGYEMDLAVAAGSDLVVVHGRDRKLSLDREEQAKVQLPQVEQHTLEFTIRSLAIGNFTRNDSSQVAALSLDGVVHIIERESQRNEWRKIVSEVSTGSSVDSSLRLQPDAQTEVYAGPALVRARVSVSGFDDLLVIDRASHQVHIVSRQYDPVAIPIRRDSDTQGPTEVDALSSVTTLDVEAEPIAILPMRLNADALSDLVVLKSSSASPLAVTLTVAARTFTVNSSGDAVDVNPGDGICETAPGNGVCTLQAAVREVNAGPGGDEIHFSVPSINATSGFNITKTVTIDGGSARVVISGTNNLTIQAANCVIRGLTLNSFTNVGGGYVIKSQDNGGNNLIEGCYIGTDASGSNAVWGTSGGKDGVELRGSANNTVGGTALAARNIIAPPPPGAGILISTGSPNGSPGNKLQGNYIGTDISGTKALGILGGIWVASTSGTSPNQIVGGTEAGATNVIATSGGDNIKVTVQSGILIQGNLIGTNAAGTSVLASNSNGVVFTGAMGCTVGGTTPDAPNLISTGTRVGVSFDSTSSAGLVQQNFIGTDISVTNALGNSNGVNIGGNSCTVGGAVTGASNIISGNNGNGVSVSGSNNLVLSNYIGTDETATVDLGNRSDAVTVTGSNNRIGDTEGHGNIMAFSKFGSRGLAISGSNNVVQHNGIGTNADGDSLGNSADGVAISGSNNTIGGTEDGAGNIIAFNGFYGVFIGGGTGNVVRRNSIFGNAVLGIGNFAANSAKTPTLSGTTGALTGATPNTSFIIEFFANETCAGPGFEQAKNFIGDLTVMTDASGNASFNLPAGPSITATASATGLNTSSLSNCVAGTPLPSQIGLNPTRLSFDATVGQGNPASKTVTLTNTGGGTLNWQGAAATTAGGNWLSVTPASGSLAASQSTTLTISIDSSALLSDIYMGAITITSAGATNSPQKVDVTLLVGCPAGSTAGSAAGQGPLAPSCLDVLDLSNPVPDSAPVMGFISVQDVMNNGLKATVTYRLASRKSADLVLRVFDQAGNRRGSSAIKSITRSDPLPNPISEEFVIPGGSIDLGTLGGVEAQTLTMYALLIDPLNPLGDTVIARSREFSYTLVKEDSITIRQATINGVIADLNNPDNRVPIGDDGDVVVECDIEYQLISDPIGGIISLGGFDVLPDEVSTPLPIALTNEPVSRTAKPKTKHLALRFRIPAASLRSELPRGHIRAVLADTSIPPRRLAASQSVSFSARDWLVINSAKANDVPVYPNQSLPSIGDGMINLAVNITYLLTSTAGGTIEVIVSENLSRVGSKRETVPRKTAFDGSVDVALSFKVSELALNGLTVTVNLTSSDNETFIRQRFVFNLASTPKTDYRFQGTRGGSPNIGGDQQQTAQLDVKGESEKFTERAPEITAAAASLIDLINPGTSTPNSFVTDTVDGESTNVLKFPYNNGLALSPTTDAIANNVYTVVMLLNFDEANKARRLIDFKNGASDGGLYADASNRLDFRGIANGASAVIPANTYVQVALTRDADKIVTGYVNGMQQFQFTDTNNDAVIDPNNTLRFFQDNLSGGTTGEASAGSVARIRLYERALAASEIAALDREPSTAQFSAASYTVGEGAGFTTITVTRAGHLTLPATVNYITIDDTARQGTDYMTASGTLSFGAGETSKTFQVPIIDNALVDLDRNATLFLTNSNGVALLAQSVAVLTISDNDTADSVTHLIQFSAANYTTGESNGRVNITVTRSGATSAAASVAFGTIDDAGLQ